jgi:predicted enzyme related to lactoylglutathione lyase
MTRFCRYQLRTTDIPAARAFYAPIVDLGDGAVDVVPLPPEAAARGAPPHWLAHLAVDDVEALAAAFVARGATRLGPPRPAPGGGDVAILRDPGGAVVALTTSPPPAADTVWPVLNTPDFPRTTAAYSELFGWTITDRIELGPRGVYHQFAWIAGGASAGAITDITGRSGVHPHWLVNFRVAAFDATVATVAKTGGEIIDQVTVPGVARIAVCHDPQGAIFALREPAA